MITYESDCIKSKQAKIQIYVSRRIDIDSVAIDNPFFVPVRCGAKFDKNSSPYMGDNVGENISDKSMMYSEFTVQYWAWKNACADYIGLCHYRRYLSFVDYKFKIGLHGLVVWPILDNVGMRRFGLLNVGKMYKIITQYDIVHSAIPVSVISTPKGNVNSVQELWEAHYDIVIPTGLINHLLKLIDHIAPEFSESAREYFAKDVHIGYNCYVMRREIFERLCAFQFPIMEELTKELNKVEACKRFIRAPAYAGEMLFGIFLYHVEKKEQRRSKIQQLVIFEETEMASGIVQHLLYYERFELDQIVRKASQWFLPNGSSRREIAKEIYLKLTGR